MILVRAFYMSIALFVLLAAYTAFAQEPIPMQPVAPAAEEVNSICLAEGLCLTGVPAAILIYFSMAVTVATYLMKKISDKNKWYAKILSMFAELQIKGKK